MNKNLENLDMEMSDFDVFAKKVQFPRSTPRLTRSWFADRIQLGHGTHLRGFAAEVLTAVNVLAMFVQLVVKPAGILNEHVQCFEAMQRVFAIFQCKGMILRLIQICKYVQTF